MDDFLMTDGQFKEDGKALVRHVLILAGTDDVDILISCAPVFGQSDEEPFRSLGNEIKVQLRPGLHHGPGLWPPVIGCGVEEIGGKAGVDVVSVRLELVLLPAVPLNRQVEGGCLMDDRGIPAELGITTINIAMRAPGTYLCTAMPGIPVCHREHLLSNVYTAFLPVPGERLKTNRS